ncbi:23S rRNA (uracil-5-)-methyltransferase RumA [Rubidibacter lacunae KORDI 51-2]|uniref:23S rRNA (Uracil-5-)-methyltransferase RumA n=1 Tax=Rubidibacter lacunae KORDI 51-2 TaxID=582515 RepID=U5D7U5_9CHRO|nr:23S rRNA (uracil(1939)-C(5))-methyltransferase RlmD [Rubidibacter lacunae]ERN40688.1 23S rRNA (uracil-5-)-methyltransferase RumA [Rubidibacter lacunae KORDI 51-2]
MTHSPVSSIPWQQGSIVEIDITDLCDRGDGVGRWGDRVVFVPDTVPGDRACVRLVRVKPQYADAKLRELLEASPHRIRPRCIVADKCGGCQWQHVSDDFQRQAKVDRIRQALERIGGFQAPEIGPILTGDPLGYRNKVTYPLGRSQTGSVQAGYYRRGTHTLVNLNRCPVQDPHLDSLLADVKRDIEARGWSIYNQTRRTGRLRHLSLRVGRRTGELLLTLVSATTDLPDIEAQGARWLERYPQLVGVCLNHNPEPGNNIFGSSTRCIVGRDAIFETFAGLDLQLTADTFFQVNTEVAEHLCDVVSERLELTGNELLIDAYCGIGTFTLPLARHVRQAIGIESQAAAVTQAEHNAARNAIANVTFYVGNVRDWLPKLLASSASTCPDAILLDPPRKGCDRAVLDALLELNPSQIAYVSCKPATLARDLNALCATSRYHLRYVQPADFFPQTTHVEAVAFLRREGSSLA